MLDTSYMKTYGKIRQHYLNKLEEASLKHGFTLSESRLILFLYNNPDISLAKDIVEIRGFSKGYISQNAKKLKERNFIFEKECDDKRSKQLFINKDKIDVIKKLAIEQEKIAAELSKGVTIREMRTIYKVLNKVANNIEKSDY